MPTKQFVNFDYKINNPNEQFKFIMPIEINFRLGGAEVWSFNKCVYDVDLIEAITDLSLGILLDENELKLKQDNPRFICISKDFHSPGKCRIKSIKIDMEKLKKNDNVIEILIDRKLNEPLTEVDFFGYTTVKRNLDTNLDKLSDSLY